jgi:hypothetical protein
MGKRLIPQLRKLLEIISANGRWCKKAQTFLLYPIFVEVFDDPLENCKRDKLDKIQKAVMLANKYYYSHVFIFSKRRFSDYAAKQAPLDESLSFVEVERLKF